MRKIDAYKVKTGANLASSKFWNAILEDIDLRVHARELDAEAINKAADELIAVGVARVNQTFNPLITQSTQAMQAAISLLNAAQQQVADTIERVNGELQDFLVQTASQVNAILAGGFDAGTFVAPSGGKIRMLHSTVAGQVPAALDAGEFAVNHADGVLFYRKADGTVGAFNLLTAATQAWVTAQVNALLDAAPAALDTLNELATALGDDANFATTMTNALAARLRFDAAQTLTAGQVMQLFANAGLGAAATKAIATAANIRANSGSDVLTTDQAWASAGFVDLGNVSGNVTLDLDVGSCFRATLTGNITLSFANGRQGQSVTFIAIQDGTGGRTVSYAANKFFFPLMTAPTASTAAGGFALVLSGKLWTDLVKLICVGWRVS
jgi:hypothetical protein